MVSVLDKRDGAPATISEMSETYGVTLRTLRFYEQIGLLKPSRCGTARLYTPRDRIKVRLIIMGRRFGLTLREIDRLIKSHETGDGGFEITSIYDVLDAPTTLRQIDEMVRQKADLEQAIALLQARLDAIEGPAPLMS